VIRNVHIHVTNEQPLLADLYDIPTAADAGLLCTNVRMMDGKRPVFIDRIDASFFFPYHVIRFIEIPVGALDAHDPAPVARPEANASKGRTPVEDLPEMRLPVPVGPRTNGTNPGDEGDLEIDEDFLRRVRDI
jgi:hypothetical protein